MSNETIITINNIYNSKYTSLYVGLVSIVFLVLTQMLIENNYSISSSTGSISPPTIH